MCDVCAIALGLRLLRSTVDMMALLCRLCQSSSPIDTAVSLFSQTAAQQSYQMIASLGKRKLERLEKTAEELESFRSEAKNTYSTHEENRAANQAAMTL